MQNTTETGQPDYIKVYDAFFELIGELPYGCASLLVTLACKMSYTNAKRPEMSQIVYTGYPDSRAIIEECGWSTEPTGKGNNIKGQDSLNKGLRTLCNCNAIRRVGRGAYQINPHYISKGEWEYNPQKFCGGVREFTEYYDKQVKKS